MDGMGTKKNNLNIVDELALEIGKAIGGPLDREVPQVPEILRLLGEIRTQLNAAPWRLERAAAVEQLRQVCEEHGDNDWKDNLHLADVIEKHLGRQLDAEKQSREDWAAEQRFYDR